MITLYTHPMSPCAQKVRIVLAEKQLSWQPRLINLQQKENLEPWYLALNPLGVVPTLVEDETPIIESSIICEYLEDRYPEISLRQGSAAETAQMRFWMKHIDTKLHPSCGALQWPLVMRPALLEKTAEEQQALINQVVEKPRRERQRRLLEQGLLAPDVVDAVKTYATTIDMMEQTLKRQEWLAGDQFSLADCAMAPYFQTIKQFGWEIFFASAPTVAKWFNAISNRKSYQLAVSADFSDQLCTELLQTGEEALPIIRQHLGLS
ncbi:glutathione S-transferase family protein [Amphritea sp. HPY]|uniref:glutathione S-transferase family protein n=1 Tax=Amphritea sp. HPY TaxID=3421652 RepID=UPI003D7EDEDA